MSAMGQKPTLLEAGGMSALGQKRSQRRPIATSALPQTTDIIRPVRLGHKRTLARSREVWHVDTGVQTRPYLLAWPESGSRHVEAGAPLALGRRVS